MNISRFIAPKQKSREERIEQLITKATSIFGLIFTAWGVSWGIFQYQDQNLKELRKSIFNEQLIFYKNITSSAASLAMYPDDSVGRPSFEKDKSVFRALMLSQSALIGDVKVEEKNQNFWLKLDSYTYNNRHVTQDTLEQAALQISLAARESLQRTWGENIPELDRLKSLNDDMK